MRWLLLIFGGAALMALSLPFIIVSLLGSWTAVEAEQLVRWASGVVGMALAIWGGQILNRGWAQRRWPGTSA